MKWPALPLWLEIAGAIFVALVLSNLATFAFFSFGGEQRFTRFASDVQAERIAGAVGMLVKAPAAMREELSRALSGPGLSLSVDAAPIVTDAMTRDTAIEMKLAAGLPGIDVRAHRLSEDERAALRPAGPPPLPPPSGEREGPRLIKMEPPELFVSVPTADGRWANARFGMRPPGAPAWPLFYAGGTLIAALLLAAFWIGRRVARPLQRLAEAAGALRRGELRGAVPETGPQPVREAARAFNAMSERVMTMLKSQRAMMAAVAHDLRTPIAALRFRAEFVSDEETRGRLLETIGEMQTMTEAVLDALRAGGPGEAARTVDVAALAESLCADMAELGGDVAFVPGEPAVCTCRVAETRRALRNLIENALSYGVRARVSTEVSGGAVLMHVDDEGPGIPDDQIERMFEPFARLEESRSAETGGHGLGLAIARLIARGHGGEVTLQNRAGGGLRATISLPLG